MRTPSSNTCFFVFTLLASLTVHNSLLAESIDEKACVGADDDASIAACTRLLRGKNVSTYNRLNYLFNRATAYYNKDDKNLCDPAIKDLREAIGLWSTDNFDDDLYLDIHNRLGSVLRECKADPDGAIAAFDEGIRYQPARAAALYTMRSMAWSDKHDFDKALSDINTAISMANINAGKARALNLRALIWRDKGSYDNAIADLNEAIRLGPKISLYYSNRGEEWRLKGDLDRALSDHSRAITLSTENGDSALAYVLRGDTKRYRGDYAGALADYDSALKSMSGYTPAFTGQGLTYEKQGNVTTARTKFQQAVASQRSDRSSGIWRSAAETAVARLAAFDSGQAPPPIPAAPIKATSATSIPTPALLPQSPVAAPQSSSRRVALVIGNSAYKNVPALLNPQNDATAVAEKLKSIGFQVVALTKDATREQMTNALRNFADEAEKSDWAMVYYAGHGMEVGGVNYLVPVDARLAVDRDIQFEAIPLTQVLNAADAAKKIKLVMLDACRDNPFKPRQTAKPDAMAASMSTAGEPITTRSSNGRGLAEVKVTGATLVVYAAKDGQVALDGEGGNSPFAVAVIQRIATPGVEINKLFRLVRDDVMEATAGRQEPYSYGSLPGKEDFFLVSK